MSWSCHSHFPHLRVTIKVPLPGCVLCPPAWCHWALGHRWQPWVTRMMSRYVTPGNLRHVSRMSRSWARRLVSLGAPGASRGPGPGFIFTQTRQTRVLTPKLSRRQDLAQWTLLTGRKLDKWGVLQWQCICISWHCCDLVDSSLYFSSCDINAGFVSCNKCPTSRMLQKLCGKKWRIFLVKSNFARQKRVTDLTQLFRQ